MRKIKKRLLAFVLSITMVIPSMAGGIASVNAYAEEIVTEVESFADVNDVLETEVSESLISGEEMLSTCTETSFCEEDEEETSSEVLESESEISSAEEISLEKDNDEIELMNEDYDFNESLSMLQITINDNKYPTELRNDISSFNNVKEVYITYSTNFLMEVPASFHNQLIERINWAEGDKIISYRNLQLVNPYTVTEAFKIEESFSVNNSNGKEYLQTANVLPSYPCESANIYIPLASTTLQLDSEVGLSNGDDVTDIVSGVTGIYKYSFNVRNLILNNVEKLDKNKHYYLFSIGKKVNDYKLWLNDNITLGDLSASVNSGNNKEYTVFASKNPEIVSIDENGVRPGEVGKTLIAAGYYSDGILIYDILNVKVCRNVDADKFTFYDSEIEYTLNKIYEEGEWKGAYQIAEVHPNVRIKPEGAVDIYNSSDVTWDLLDGNTPVASENYNIVKEGDYYKYLEILKPGDYTFRITLNDVTDAYGYNVKAEQRIIVENQFDESDIGDENFPRAYAVNNYDTKLSDVQLLIPHEYRPKGDWGYAVSYIKDKNGDFSNTKNVSDVVDGRLIEESYSYEWANPDTSFALYKGFTDYSFPVKLTKTTKKYSTPEGEILTDSYTKDYTIMVNVAFVDINGIRMVGAGYDIDNKNYWYGPFDNNPQNIGTGDTAQYELQFFDINGLRREDNGAGYERYVNQDEYDYILSRLPAYNIIWSNSQVKASGTVVDNEALATESRFGNSAYRVLFGNEVAGKKNIITCSIVDKNNAKKVLYKSSITTFVTKKPVADFHLYWGMTEEENQAIFDKYNYIDTDKKELVVVQEAANYYKLTFTSLDNSVIKLKAPVVADLAAGEEYNGKSYENDVKITRVPYEQLSAGACNVKVLATDEIKSLFMWNIVLESDNAPVMLANQYTINLLAEDLAELVIYVDSANDISEENGLVLSGKDKDKFVLKTDTIATYTAEGDNPAMKGIILNIVDGVAKNKTYDLALDVTTANGKTTSLPFKVKTIEKKADIKVKQTEKLNSFYNDSVGEIFISGEDIGGIKTWSVGLTDCDYEVASVVSGMMPEELRIMFRLKEGADGKDKSGNISFKYNYGVKTDVTFTQKINLSVIKKAPVITLYNKADTMYAASGIMESSFTLYNNDTQNNLNLTAEGSSINLIASKSSKTALKIIDKNNPESDPDVEISGGKNSYDACYYYKTEDDEVVESYIYLNAEKNETIKAGKDTFKFEVKAGNWTAPVTVTYSVTANNTIPKLKLAKTSVSLNKNGQVYNSQEEYIGLTLLNSFHNIFALPGCSFNVEGADAKAENEINNGNLGLGITDEGNLRIRLIDNSIGTGTYKYNVVVKYGEADNQKIIKAPFTVKIVDTDPAAKNIAVKQSGTIDVLDRDNTYVSIKATVKNMAGKVDFIKLDNSGDWEQFRSEYDEETGELKIYANMGARLATNITYKVTPVYEIGISRVIGKTINIKVKQSPVKISFRQNDTVFYANYGSPNTCLTVIDAVFNKDKNAVIDRVEQADMWDCIYYIEDGEAGRFRSGYNIGNYIVKKKGETVTVTYKVFLREAAVNSKPVTFKIKYKIAKL